MDLEGYVSKCISIAHKGAEIRASNSSLLEVAAQPVRVCMTAVSKVQCASTAPYDRVSTPVCTSCFSVG